MSSYTKNPTLTSWIFSFVPQGTTSFDIEEAAEFEEQNQRYPFDEYDDAFYDMEPLETYLKKFIRENVKDF